MTFDLKDNYPFTGHTLDLDGLSYHYLDEGAGDPVVMVHGNPSWSIYYRNLVLALRGSYRCIVPDHIGCGLSDKPSPKEYSYRLAQRIADLGQLLETLDLRQITLVAHDWGGGVGMGAAVAMPERFKQFKLHIIRQSANIVMTLDVVRLAGFCPGRFDNIGIDGSLGKPVGIDNQL